MLLAGAVGKGQILTQSMLGTNASVVANGGLVPPTGKVAVTIQVCLSQDVAGYVIAGSYVSVFDTYPPNNAVNTQNVQNTCDLSHPVQHVTGPDEWITRIVLPSVHVLAVGQSPGSQGTSAGIASTVESGQVGQTNNPVMVTLAVPQVDAERLIAIDEVGLPYLALLAPNAHPGFDSNTPPSLFRTTP